MQITLNKALKDDMLSNPDVLSFKMHSLYSPVIIESLSLIYVNFISQSISRDKWRACFIDWICLDGNCLALTDKRTTRLSFSSD